MAASFIGVCVCVQNETVKKKKEKWLKREKRI